MKGVPRDWWLYTEIEWSGSVVCVWWVRERCSLVLEVTYAVICALIHAVLLHMGTWKSTNKGQGMRAVGVMGYHSDRWSDGKA